MNCDKKAIGSYVYIITFVCLVMSVFLFIMIEVLYEDDSELCENMAFDYETVCRDGGGSVTVKIQNNGQLPISFEIAGEIEERFYLESGESARESVTIDGNSIRAYPIVIDENGEGNICRSKRQRDNTEVLSSC